MRDSLSSGWRAFREELIAGGSVAVLEQGIRFEKNVLFSSPSAAAAVLSGGVSNGREAWKNEAGRSINDLEQEISMVEPAEPSLGTSVRYDDDDAE